MPARLALVIRFGAPQVQIGLALAAAVLAILAVLVPISEPLYRSYDKMTPGEVVRVVPHGVPIVGEDVQAVDVRYVDPRGASRVVRSYASARLPQPGDVVAVVYAADDPDEVCVAGMRPAPAPLEPAFTLLPLLGLGVVLVLSGAPRALRLMGLLRHGRLRQGTRVAPAARTAPAELATFEFPTVGGAHARCTARSPLLALLGPDARVPIVYDPGKPTNAAVLPLVPGAPTIDDAGRLHATAPPNHALRVAVWPAACAVALVVALARVALWL